MTYMPSRLFPRGARPIARPIYRFAGCRGCCCLLRCFSCCCRVSRPSQHRCPPIHRLWVHRESRCQATRTVASYWHASHSRCLRARLLPSILRGDKWRRPSFLPSFLPVRNMDGSFDEEGIMGRGGAGRGVGGLSWNDSRFLACDKDGFSFLFSFFLVRGELLENCDER